MMSPEGRARRWSWRRARLVLRLASLGLILVGPIALGAWDLREGAPEALGYTPLRLDGPAAARSADAASVREYLARRNPVVDRLLPEGAGGTRFVEQLDGNAGMAFSSCAAIALAPSAASDPWGESIELHERAHLVFAFLPHEVAALMARLGPPNRDEYAATNTNEHFAEMAAKAWEVVVPPALVCVDGTPAERLRQTEARVPGTAGFLEWYLRSPAFAEARGREALVALARELSAPQRAEWDALWRGLDARRQADGSFARWRDLTIRGAIERRRLDVREEGGWLGRVAAWAYLPSLWLLAMLGR